MKLFVEPRMGLKYLQNGKEQTNTENDMPHQFSNVQFLISISRRFFVQNFG